MGREVGVLSHLQQGMKLVSINRSSTGQHYSLEKIVSVELSCASCVFHSISGSQVSGLHINWPN